MLKPLSFSFLLYKQRDKLALKASQDLDVLLFDRRWAKRESPPVPLSVGQTT
jgi:hypothetical protein